MLSTLMLMTRRHSFSHLSTEPSEPMPAYANTDMRPSPWLLIETRDPGRLYVILRDAQAIVSATRRY